MPDITPITVDGNLDELMANLQYLDGEELDLLSDIGVELAELGSSVDADGNPVPGKIKNRTLVAFGFVQLHRRHPDLDWETGRRYVRLDLTEVWNATPPAEVREPTPTNAND